MALSGINNYRDALFQWQSQQLRNTGNSGGSSVAGSQAASLFSGASMTSQISGMIELTRYAMDAMGVGSDGRVTFSQIARYRQQLQSEFEQSVKKGLADSGISDISGLVFTLDKDGRLSVASPNAADQKTAQAWLDANPSFGEDLLKNTTDNAKEVAFAKKSVQFKLSSTGRIGVVNDVQNSLQSAMNQISDLADKARAGLKEAGIVQTAAIDLVFDDDGALRVGGDNPQADQINSWLRENSDLADEIRKILEKGGVQSSAASFRLGNAGSIQISVNDATIKDIQAAMDNSADIGKKLVAGLSSLGIDPAINFSIQVDENGALSIVSDHPDRDKMQRFFEENPDLVKKYRQIETLAGIDDARKAMQIAPAEMRKRIQIESMASWWVESGSGASYFGNYNDGSLSLLAGLNMRV